MGRRAAFFSDEKSQDLENPEMTDGKKAKEQLALTDSENHFSLAKAVVKWILISIAVMMAVGYLVEALDSKARFSLGSL
jgi:hypothetical protein